MEDLIKNYEDRETTRAYNVSGSPSMNHSAGTSGHTPPLQSGISCPATSCTPCPSHCSKLAPFHPVYCSSVQLPCSGMFYGSNKEHKGIIDSLNALKVKVDKIESEIVAVINCNDSKASTNSNADDDFNEKCTLPLDRPIPRNPQDTPTVMEIVTETEVHAANESVNEGSKYYLRVVLYHLPDPLRK